MSGLILAGLSGFGKGLADVGQMGLKATLDEGVQAKRMAAEEEMQRRIAENKANIEQGAIANQDARRSERAGMIEEKAQGLISARATSGNPATPEDEARDRVTATMQLGDKDQQEQASRVHANEINSRNADSKAELASVRAQLVKAVDESKSELNRAQASKVKQEVVRATQIFDMTNEQLEALDIVQSTTSTPAEKQAARVRHDNAAAKLTRINPGETLVKKNAFDETETVNKTLNRETFGSQAPEIRYDAKGNAFKKDPITGKPIPFKP